MCCKIVLLDVSRNYDPDFSQIGPTGVQIRSNEFRNAAPNVDSVTEDTK